MCTHQHLSLTSFPTLSLCTFPCTVDSLLNLLSHKAPFFFSCFWFGWSCSSFTSITTYSFLLLKLTQAIRKLCTDSLLLLCNVFLHTAKAVRWKFSIIPYLHSKTNVKLWTRSRFELQSLGTVSRQVLLSWGRTRDDSSTLEWASSPAIHLF